MVVEHPRRVDQRLGEEQRPPRVAGQQHALGERGGGLEMDRRHGAGRYARRWRDQTDGRSAMAPEFGSREEFREAMNEIFRMMSEDPEMGPRLQEADVPQRFEFSDVDLVLNARAATAEEEGCLHWEWTDDVAWEAKVRMTMSTETANKYFQGKENIPIAIARRRIRTGGDVKAALALIPITKPIFARYRAWVSEHHPHLVA